MPFIESLISVTNTKIHKKTFGVKPQRLDPGLAIVHCCALRFRYKLFKSTCYEDENVYEDENEIFGIVLLSAHIEWLSGVLYVGSWN